MLRCICRGILLSVVATGGSAGQERPVDDRLIERVLQKDIEVVEEMVNAGPGIIARLVPLTRHDHRDVREIALYCLAQKGGKRARAAFVRALYDRDSQIRAIAAGSLLHEHYGPGILDALLRALRKHKDGLVREEVALVVGKIGEPRAMPALRKLQRKEKNLLVLKNLRLALARLGDEKSRNSILDGLRAEKVKTRLQALREFGYMNASGLLGHLLPLLEDERDAVNVAPAGHKAYIRMCDVAVEIADAVLHHPESYRIGKIGNVRKFTPEEIAKARQEILSLIGPQ